MSETRRIDARQIQAAIKSAKENDALRVEIDGEKLVVVLSEKTGESGGGFAFDHEQDHNEAA